MAHRSGFERRLLSYPYPPLLQAVPSVLPPRRGLAISSSSVRVKHCTTSVYNGHGTCRGLRPSQWAQPPRLSRRLAVKPNIGRTSQTANPMVIGSLHSPRLGGKHGEVKLDSFSGGQLFGNFARYKSRPCLPLQEEDRTMVLHLGGFPCRTGPACPALITTLDHPLIQVNLDQGTWDSILWWRILANLQKGIPLGTPLIDAFLFADSSAVGCGAHMTEMTTSGRWSVAMKDLHINVLELKAIWLGLQAFEDTLQDSNVAIMCDNGSAIAYLRNQGSQQMCHMAIDTCEWAEKWFMGHIESKIKNLKGILR